MYFKDNLFKRTFPTRSVSRQGCYLRHDTIQTDGAAAMFDEERWRS